MRKWICALVLMCLFGMALSSGAQAAAIEKKCVKRDYNSSCRTVSPESKHNFWFWLNSNDLPGAQSERVSGGVNFKIKMENNFSQDSVDAYRFEISAEDAFEEPIKLEASDGRYYSSLYYDGDRTFRPGTNGYTESFRLRSNDKIRYVNVKLIRYHTDEGTVDVDESHQKEYSWKIN